MELSPEKLVEWFIAGFLAVIGWLISTFTKRHIASMDTLAAKLDLLGTDIHEMRGDIRVLRERQESADGRIERLEALQDNWSRGDDR